MGELRISSSCSSVRSSSFPATWTAAIDGSALKPTKWLGILLTVVGISVTSVTDRVPESARADAVNLIGLVLGRIEANFCKKICV